jgi:hypothetical protein
VIWDVVTEDWLALIVADSALQSVFGGTVQFNMATSTVPVTIPSIEYLLIFDLEGENFNRWGLQVDFWTHTSTQARTIERRIRLLTHRDTAWELNGRRIWSRLTDARTIEYAREKGVIHRSLDFEFEALRSKRTYP